MKRLREIWTEADEQDRLWFVINATSIALSLLAIGISMAAQL